MEPAIDASGKLTGWQYGVQASGTVETYDINGKLQSVRERNGRTTTLAYNAANQLTTVTAPSGRTLSFAYDTQNRLTSVSAPDGATTKYAYNATGMLSSVARPDGAVRQYVYEDTRFPTALADAVGPDFSICFCALRTHLDRFPPSSCITRVNACLWSDYGCSVFDWH